MEEVAAGAVVSLVKENGAGEGGLGHHGVGVFWNVAEWTID